MKKLLTFTLVALFFHTSFSQNFWELISESSIPASGPRYVLPRKYQTAWLDVLTLESSLQNVPERFTPAALQISQLPVLTLLNPEGRITRFHLAESPVMHPDLQAQFPEIRCYTGYGIDDPTAKLKCDVTPWGFHAMVRSAEKGTWFIEPYSHGDRQHYMIYYKQDNPRPEGEQWECLTEDRPDETDTPTANGTPEQGDCMFRQYRIGVACTGEYATFHGGTTSLVLAAINTSVNRVAGVYEDEIGVTMQLISNNSVLIYLNATTDPYTNNNGSTMLGENQTIFNNVIGSANYDIGHVFSTGGGGVAGLGVVCSSTNKARGVTGRGAPIGDLFDIDYVAHEIGHQFNGSHSFNAVSGSCNGNRSANNAMETGSGQTIMAYAGICSPYNIANQSDAYFHAISLQNIASLITASGHTCDLIINNGNSNPTVNGGADYTIPRSTPFALTATGSDPNGNSLSYNWEQMNNQSATYPLTSTNPQGPNFRSYWATSSPTRYFPNLAAIIANTTPAYEVLPSIARTLNFRVTARDVGGTYGCTAEDNVIVTVNGTAGPFLVTVPNTAVNWPGNSFQTVTWNVAGTTANSVNCANVKISLSTDGGLTYPTVLLASTPNDGSETITVPNTPTTTARIKVEGVGNIFFDISNTNFTITFSLPVELLDFQVNKDGDNAALLQWATASEKNNRGFEIEMKHETEADFQKAGFVKGSGTTTDKQTYSYTVRNLKNGTWYFRLKQIDEDGSVHYSPVQSVEIRSALAVKLFPNPVHDKLNVTVFSEEEAVLSFELINQIGQRFQLASSEHALQRGYNSFQFNVGSLPAGVYYYVCRTEASILQGEVVVK